MLQNKNKQQKKKKCQEKDLKARIKKKKILKAEEES